LPQRVIEEWERHGPARDRQHSQTVALMSSFLCGCERRSFWTVTVEHPTESAMTNTFCVNNDFGRFSAIFIGIFHCYFCLFTWRIWDLVY